MRLYHMPGSRSSRTLWALEEAGASYDITYLTAEEKASQTHAKRHPLGRVPVLELDNGGFVFESAAIALQIGDLYPQSGLLPAIDDHLRAHAYQWTLFSVSELEPALFGVRRAGTDDTTALERYIPIQGALTETLADRSWLLGDTFTVPDVLTATILSNAVRASFAEVPTALSDYVTRAQQRPAYLRAEKLGRRPSD